MATCSSTSSKIAPSKDALKPSCEHPILSTFDIPTSPVPKTDPYEHLHIAPNLDGTITRLLNVPTVEANPEATHGDAVVCKDLTLNAEKQTWIRIYRPTKLPSNDNTIARLPIIIYFHGGGFILLKASMKQPHQTCSELASEIPAIVVSLDYRLAPEHRLPAQYEDAIDAILWAKQQVMDTNGEQWLKDYGDCSRCYLCGRGCGGNMVFHAALSALDLDLKPLKISGLVLNQPMFGGSERKKSELMSVDDPVLPIQALDLMWELSLPVGTDRDHPFCNPVVEGPHKRKISSLGRCLVTGFSGDAMFDRMQDLVSMLLRSGVKVEARFHDPGFHNVDIVDGQCALTLLNSIKEFVI
ncbi:hypothetical protein P3X46_003775 [Hevea brasiliensis]|uniref:Alpha/beta hydrolase fold-3 domain-containing protein n=2 Tax=Hevea brasiliensis TaxID=3981 RepID=A0ABQ9N7B9_HEVBR|nr:hypothetical protein P3X46_003775 [Hevea brasiliensis]